MADDRAVMPSFSSGQSVFVPDEEQCYALAKVSAVQGATVTATKKSGESVSTKDAVHFDPYDEEQGDLVQMTNVDPANMLNTLRARHKAGHAYTNAGQRGIVISVNPYKWVDICARSFLSPRRAHWNAFIVRAGKQIRRPALSTLVAGPAVAPRRRSPWQRA